MPPMNSPPTSAADRLREAASFNIRGWTRLMRIAIFLFGLALDVRKNDRFVEPDITGPSTSVLRLPR
jgi:hypothetical protein